VKQFFPAFVIIKITVTGVDLRSSTVLKTLHTSGSGFGVTEGWALRLWSDTLTLPLKYVTLSSSPSTPSWSVVQLHAHFPTRFWCRGKGDVTATWYRPYLIHLQQGHVITVHHNAWMDCAALCMWAVGPHSHSPHHSQSTLFLYSPLPSPPYRNVLEPSQDVQLGPYVTRGLDPILLVWDNLAAHKHWFVQKYLWLRGVYVESLPANTTDWLQVMDLVVNGPLKAIMRRLRCNNLYDAFQIFKRAYLKASLARVTAAGRKQPLPPLPTWTAPKTTQTEALHTLFDTINTRFQEADFLFGLERAFERVGLKPRGDGSFAQWSGSGLKGFVCKALAPAPCAEEGFTAADAAAPFYLEQPPAGRELEMEMDEAPGP